MDNSSLGKHRYRKLKVSLMFRVCIKTALLALLGYLLIFRIFDDYIPYRNLVYALYIMLVFFFVFYRSLAVTSKFLDEVIGGIDNVLDNKYESIVLIDELRPLEIKLNELKVQLEKQEEEIKEGEGAKNDLILYLAHDLKTPLTSIIAYLDMLDKHPEMDEKTRRKYIRVAYDKAERMKKLTEEFFEITKYHLQGIVLEKEEFSIDLMLKQIADELYGVLQTKNMKCRFDSDEDILVHADPDKMARVFDNLLRNAIAYSFENSTIRILAKDLGDFVKITFTNAGPTIPPVAIDNLFDKFYRADNSRSSSTGGAGLGLAIARDIIDAHGGIIKVESKNSITRFTVVIPVDSVE